MVDLLEVLFSLAMARIRVVGYVAIVM